MRLKPSRVAQVVRAATASVLASLPAFGLAGATRLPDHFPGHFLASAHSSGAAAWVVSITLDTYSHAIPAMQEEAAERIAGLVFVRA